MKSHRFNKIQKVFICDKENPLKLVNINFDKTILKIIPFEGVSFNAGIERTILHAQTIMDRSKKFITEPGIGKFIRLANEN